MLGIQFTWGHLVVAGIVLVIYDAVWTWIASDPASGFWFGRPQILLKVGIYAGVVAVLTLIAYVGWPWNLVITLSAALSVLSIFVWLKRQSKDHEEEKESEK